MMRALTKHWTLVKTFHTPFKKKYFNNSITLCKSYNWGEKSL